MNPREQNIAVGAFVLASIGLLVYGIYFLKETRPGSREDPLTDTAAMSCPSPTGHSPVIDIILVISDEPRGHALAYSPSRRNNRCNCCVGVS